MFRFILTIASMGVAVALALAWTLLMPAHAHDYKRPDLDGWYSSLHRKGLTFGCCSKEDGHTTEAEVRNGVWWARIGRPVIGPDGVDRDWVLLDWVRTPDELIVRGENDLPVSNPEGEAVLCHSIVWRGADRPDELDSINTRSFALCRAWRAKLWGAINVVPSALAQGLDKASSPGSFSTRISKSRRLAREWAGSRAPSSTARCATIGAWQRQRFRDA